MQERRAVAGPWAYFLPVALASFVGALAAGLFWRSVAPTVDNGRAPPATAQLPDTVPTLPAPAGPQEPPEQQAGPAAIADPAAPPGSSRAPVDAPGPAAVATAADPAPPLPVLPGALLARRDGAAEACINGTVARRDENGWQQRFVDDAPVACVEANALLR